MTTEDRLAALEAEVRALKARLGETQNPIVTAAGGTRPPGALADPSAQPARPEVALYQPSIHQPSLRQPPILEWHPSAEVRLGSYWVTRIGAVLVLLGAIFLAAYLSIYSSAPIRVGELAGAAIAALAIAYWQQRRGNLRFALVLHSLGDALVFFTAFAAYAFDATRVIDGVALAIGAQTAAGVFVCVHALHRRAEGSATFSLVLLAWVAGFSLLYQHSEMTLSYVAAITLTAAILRARWGWNWPLLFAAVAGPVITAWLAEDFATLRGPLSLTWAVLPLVIAAPAALGTAAIARRDQAVVLAAAGIAILIALWARYSPQPHFSHQLAVEAAAILGIAGLLATRFARTDGIRSGLIVQLSFLAAITAALYLVVLRQAIGVDRLWREALVLLTVVDAALLYWAPLPARGSVGATLLVGGLLTTLCFGYAGADLPWSATFVWVTLATGTFALGFWRPNANLRLAALAVFGACLVRLFARDLNTSATRIAASFLLGIILLGIGYLYSRQAGQQRNGHLL